MFAQYRQLTLRTTAQRDYWCYSAALATFTLYAAYWFSWYAYHASRGTLPPLRRHDDPPILLMTAACTVGWSLAAAVTVWGLIALMHAPLVVAAICTAFVNEWAVVLAGPDAYAAAAAERNKKK